MWHDNMTSPRELLKRLTVVRFAAGFLASVLAVFSLSAFGQVVEGTTAASSNEMPTPARPPAGSSRSISPVAIKGAPVIDGHLDDTVWDLARASGDFWISEQERWPDEQTDVRVLADASHLYFAIRAYDSMPGRIRAIEMVQDRGLRFDDQVIVEIDTFRDHAGVSRFAINARGTQDYSPAGGRATNITWQGDWRAAVANNDDGWTAEFAIPFEVLNYRIGESKFNINFVRYHHRTRQWSRWADVTPQNKKEEMGWLAGVVPPARDESSSFIVMPYVFGGRNIVDRRGEFEEFLLTGGLDLRFSPRSSMTGVLSLNPDFTQIETQITDANFNYNEKRVADPRVFFREGAEYFGNDDRVFYSPRVPDFDAGASVFGQEQAFRYSGFVTSSPESRIDSLARLAFAPSPTHSGSLTFVGSSREELDNSTVALAVDGRQKIGAVWDLTYAATRNEPEDEGAKTGAMLDLSAGWQGDFAGVGVRYDEYDKEFAPANGLLKTDRLGTNGQSAYFNYYRLSGIKTISEQSFDIVRTYRKIDDGRVQNESWYAGGSLEWNEFVRTGLSYTDGDYRPMTGTEPGEFGDTVNQDRYWTASVDFNTRSSLLGYGASISSGELGGGDYEYAVAYVWGRPSPGTSISVSAERLESFGIFEQYIVEAGWDITPTNSIVFRHVSSDGEPYWRLGFRRRVQRGLDIFLLYDEVPREEAELSLKLLWIL
jgi:hypothetical protein